MRQRLNDYEIIAQIQGGCEASLELMIRKYEKFIAKIIHHFNLGYHFEDLMQESQMILVESVRIFDPSYGKTFTRFLELNVRRHMMSTIRNFKRKAEVFYEHEKTIMSSLHCQEMTSPYYSLHLDEIQTILNPFEYQVYGMRIINNASIALICEVTGANEKRIYNTLDRAKRKITAYYSG